MFSRYTPDKTEDNRREETDSEQSRDDEHEEPLVKGQFHIRYGNNEYEIQLSRWEIIHCSRCNFMVFRPLKI